MDISDKEFELFREFIQHRFGICLTAKKRSLLVARLQKIIRQSGFGTFRNYYDHLITKGNHSELQELINRVSTNHTFFNREKAHFDFFLERALPESVQRLRSQGEKDLRIWCAGCSSGEEAYMLMMLMREFFGHDYSRWNAGLLATDISDQVLTAARNGIYSEERIESLPLALRNKYVTRLSNGSWQMSADLRGEITFRRFNLMNTAYPFKKPFHIIFCRNVMIYFDEQDKKRVVERFYEVTEASGFLFIGHSETLGRRDGLYQYLQPAIYRKERAA